MTRKKRAVVIEPHNDDLIIGIGGTVLQLIANDWEIYSIVMCDGRYGDDEAHTPEEMKQIRAAEKQKEVERLGIDCYQMGIKDLELGERYENPETRRDLIEHIRDVLPEGDPLTMFVPAPSEAHPDHQATYKFATLLKNVTDRSIREVRYLVWEVPFYPNDLAQSGTVLKVPIDERHDEKLACIGLHESQQKKGQYAEMSSCYNKYLGYLYRGDAETVELLSMVDEDQRLLDDLDAENVTNRYH